MIKVAGLTSTQHDRVEEVCEQWKHFALDTTRLEGDSAARCISDLYALNQRKRPSRVIHVMSPLEAVELVNDFVHDGDLDPHDDTTFVLEASRELAFAEVEAASGLSARLRCEIGAITDMHGFVDRLVLPIGQKIGEIVSATNRNDPRGRRVSTAARCNVCDRNFRYALYWPYYGNFYSMMFAYRDALIEISELRRRTKISSVFQAWRRLSMSSHWHWAFRDRVIISDRPTKVCLDDKSRLHSRVGPALAYQGDGRQSVFAIEGYGFSEHVIAGEIPLASIDGEKNIERRRILIEQFGRTRYLLVSGFRIQQRDGYGVLLAREGQDGHEPEVIVAVVNSTAEPDGSFKEYHLRVPPTMRTAHQAVAWTFGKNASDYAPEFET